MPSQQLASTMGVSAHRVQVMKASFFSGDSDVVKSHRKQPFTCSFGIKHPPSLQTSPILPSPRFGDRVPLHLSSSERHTPLQMWSSRVQRTGAKVTPSGTISAAEKYPHPAVSSLQAQASVIMAKHNLSQLVPREKSLVSNKTDHVADAGLAMGRSFRVGWGPNWTLAHSGSQISYSKDSKSLGLFSLSSVLTGNEEGLPLRVLVEQVHIGPPERSSVALPNQVQYIYCRSCYNIYNVHYRSQL